MNRFKLLFFTLLIYFLSAGGSVFSCEGPLVRVALVAYTYKGIFTTYIKHEDAMQKHLPEMLRKHLPEICFDIKQYRQNDVKKLIEEGKIDLFLGSSGFYWEMRKYGARDLATFVSSLTPNPNQGNAGVIFTRKDNNKINNLSDCKGKILAGGQDSQYQAHLLSLREFSKQGYNPESFFNKIIHNDLPLQDVIKQVRDGIADVGFLRACVLESMYPGWEREFKILNRQNDSNMFCAHSTTQYPNATLAALPSLPHEYSRKIAGVLLSEPPTGPARYHWSLTTNYGNVDELYRELKLGPYLYLRDWTFKNFINKSWPFFAILLVLVVSLCIHLWRVEALVQKRTALLTKEIAYRREAQKIALQSEKRANQLQHSAIVGQLSSILAHELRQPLTIIQNLIDSLDLLLEKKQIEKSKLQFCYQGVQKQVQKIDELINKVRSYAKTSPKRNQIVDFSEITRKTYEETCGTLLTEMSPSSIHLTENLFVQGDPLELELLVRNILKNALEAATDQGGRIELSLARQNTKAFLRVVNTGKKLTEQQIKEFCEPFVSSKHGGLGLGIVISKAITEAHYGAIQFHPHNGGGLEVEISIPLAEESKNEL